MRIGLVAGLAVGLAGCSSSFTSGGDDGGGVSAFCNTLDGSGASVRANADPGCVGCSVSNPQSVSDDSPYTFASVTVNGEVPAQGATITALAPDGVSYPAGGHAGAFITRPEGGPNVQLAGGIAGEVTIRTYLDGTLQESAGDTLVNSTNSQLFPGTGDLPREFVYFVTTTPFDAVEIFITGQGFSVQAPEYRVHGLCWDGNVDS